MKCLIFDEMFGFLLMKCWWNVGENDDENVEMLMKRWRNVWWNVWFLIKCWFLKNIAKCVLEIYIFRKINIGALRTQPIS